MVYLDDYSISNFIKNLALDNKYPFIASNLSNCKAFILERIKKYSNYQRFSRRLIFYCQKYVRGSIGKTDNGLMPFDDFLKTICVRDMHQFYVYYKNDLTNFESVNFLINFVGKSLNEMQPILLNISNVCDIPYVVRNISSIYETLQKILYTYAIVYISKSFYTINIAINMNSTYILDNIYAFETYSIYPQIVKSLSNNKDFTSLFNDLDDDFNEKLHDIFNSKKLGYDIDTFKNEMMTIYMMYQKNYNFFVKKNINEILDYCKSNPDFEAIIYRYCVNKKILSNFSILKYILRYENIFFLEKLISNETIIETNDPGQIMDLKILPNKQFTGSILIEI